MPTRFVTLMNPRPRRAARRAKRARSRSGQFVSRRRTHRRRRVHSNPRPRVIYRTRRVKARRVFRRRRAHRNPPKMTTAMRAKISRAVKAANRRRGSSRALSVRRRSAPAARRSFRRRRSGGGSISRFSGGGSLMGSLRNAISKPLLMKAGGAVTASFATGFILNRFGARLPLANHQYGRVAYTLGIPVLAAFVLHKATKGKMRDFSEGLVIGGLVMTINTLMQGFRSMSAGAAPQGAVGSYAVAGELGDDNTFGYYPQGMDDTRGLGGSNIAFPQSAW